MKVASIAETKNHLSELLDRVKRGHSVLITERGRPVARLVPIEPSDDPDGRLERLERQGLIRRGRPSSETRKLILSSAPKTTDGSSIVDVVLEERREGR